MKFTLSWLKEHLDTTAEVDVIAETLTHIGLEVESVEDKAKDLAAFTVARIVTAAPHPNADKLRVLTVDNGRETLQVVCGAPNARAGLVGVFAAPDTYIPGNGMTLKVAKIRGVESFGMMCSDHELLLSNDHEGIIELSADTQIGVPAAAALGLNDPVIDISLTPNRGDCTGVYGIARDLAAAGLGTLRDRSVAPVPSKVPSPIAITLDFPRGAESACPIFAGRLIRGVINRPSPAWLQSRLKAVGLRPISALVDVTNLIALDHGRPLHVFDAATLTGPMRARLAKPSETIRALDGRTYTLDSETVVIADANAARGIAGVMGGEGTACTESTTHVFIESALFDPVRIARAGRTLGILSDARYRFERGVDPEFVLPGLELATRFILEFCGGEPADVVVAGAVPEWRRTIAFEAHTVTRLTGLDLPPGEIVRILTKLGFAVSGQESLTVTPPSWRADVHGAADLVEEIVRIHGLDNVPAAPMERGSAVARPVLTRAQRRVGWARRALAARGFDETVHFSFVARAHAQLFGGGDAARQLANPIAADLDALRPSVVPSLLASAARNQARSQAALMLFEIGAQFASGIPGDQTTVVAGLRVGQPLHDYWRDQSVITKVPEQELRDWVRRLPDVFVAKADMVAALEAAWGQPVSIPAQTGAPTWYHPGQSGVLALGPKPLAYFGELHPRIVTAFDLDGPVAAFEIFLDAIPEPKARGGRGRAALDISPYPAVERDFAFVLDASVSAEQVLKAARSVDRALIERAEVFDVYEGRSVAEGKKSLAVAVRLQPKDKTLTDAEIEAIAAKIIAAVAKATGAVLRS